MLNNTWLVVPLAIASFCPFKFLMAPTEAVSDRCYITVIKEEMEKNNESRSLKIVSPGHTTDDGIFICIDQGRVRSFYGRKIR